MNQRELEKLFEEAYERGWGRLEECFGDKSYHQGFYNCEICPAARECGREEAKQHGNKTRTNQNS